MAGIDGTVRWINLRSTLAYVTDGANQTMYPGNDLTWYYGDGGNAGINIGGTTYTCGWVRGGGLADVSLRDRTTSGDVRLAGMHFVAQNSAGFADFRLDLPATGSYEIHLAIGDNGDHINQYVAIYDNTTLKTTVIDSASNHVADNFFDAGGTNRTRAAWPGAEVGVSVTFASTIMNIRCGKAAFSSDSVTLAAIGIKSLAPAGGFLSRNFWWDNV